MLLFVCSVCIWWEPPCFLFCISLWYFYWSINWICCLQVLVRFVSVDFYSSSLVIILHVWVCNFVSRCVCMCILSRNDCMCVRNIHVQSHVICYENTDRTILWSRPHWSGNDTGVPLSDGIPQTLTSPCLPESEPFSIPMSQMILAVIRLGRYVVLCVINLQNICADKNELLWKKYVGRIWNAIDSARHRGFPVFWEKRCQSHVGK